jgi:hypothetical protein
MPVRRHLGSKSVVAAGARAQSGSAEQHGEFAAGRNWALRDVFSSLSGAVAGLLRLGEDASGSVLAEQRRGAGRVRRRRRGRGQAQGKGAARPGPPRRDKRGLRRRGRASRPGRAPGMTGAGGRARSGEHLLAWYQGPHPWREGGADQQDPQGPEGHRHPATGKTSPRGRPGRPARSRVHRTRAFPGGLPLNPLCGVPHNPFGESPGETGREQSRNRARACSATSPARA